MQSQQTTARRVNTGLVFKYVALGILSLVFLFPLAWMVATSLKTNAEVLANPTAFFPSVPQWGNYPEVINASCSCRSTSCSLGVAVGGTRSPL